MHPDDQLYATTIDRCLTSDEAQQLTTTLIAEGWIRTTDMFVGEMTLARVLASLPATWDDATREEVYQHGCAILGWTPGRVPTARAHDLTRRLASYHLTLHRQPYGWAIASLDGRALIRAPELDAIEGTVISLERPFRHPERVEPRTSFYALRW
jgi:hypothetical protein